MLPADLPIWVAVGPVDLHLSFDRLAGLVRSRFGGEPKAGLYVFLNRRADKAKVLFHDHSGWCLLYKRLDRGVFPLPETLEDRALSVRISLRELQLMLVGTQLPTKRSLPCSSPKKSTPALH